MKIKISLWVAIFSLFACTGKPTSNNSEKSSAKNTVNETQLASKGETWLKQIFTCPDDKSAFCFPDENKIMSDGYAEYLQESMDIFEYPNFENEAEEETARKAFNEKWNGIYDGRAEWYPFGRGNGDIGRLKNVTITHNSDLQYTVVVDYGDGNVFKNLVKLVPFDDVFQVDYIKTEPM